MSKVNAFLLVMAFISALFLISMRNQTKDYFGFSEAERKLTMKLEEDYKLMLLERARLTNINRVKQKAGEIGLFLPNYETRRILKIKKS